MTTMKKTMSLAARKELFAAIHYKYSKSTHQEKSKILDGVVAATGLKRKYAIHLLNSKQLGAQPPRKRGRKPKYGSDVQQALKTLWYAANRICAKRLTPFIPELIKVLELHGHLSLTPDVHSKLLDMSAATMDRLLSKERVLNGKGLSTTAPGALLKKQIQVRTFSDWNENTPGFMEIDLVAHCGGNLEGTYLNTLTMVDIVSGWIELGALLYKSSEQVIATIDVIQEVLPFSLLGIDSDNGSEFINYKLLEYCENKKITFTRSRAYRKNDQAHVEEKNGSVVRRLIGYNRYEGEQAYQVLLKLYSMLRLYINYFQPSLKLLSKTRDGSKTIKKYEKAKTPYQRLMSSETFPEDSKVKLRKEYEKLDPIDLLNKIEILQKIFFEFACVATATKKEKILALEEVTAKIEETNKELTLDMSASSKELSSPLKCNANTKKPRKKLEPRTWRTRKDPFEADWSKIMIQLSVNKCITAKEILLELTAAEPQTYHMGQLRTLQRRVAEWRKNNVKNARQEFISELPSGEAGTDYLSVAIMAGTG